MSPSFSVTFMTVATLSASRHGRDGCPVSASPCRFGPDGPVFSVFPARDRVTP
jgi:hypothetical protein